MKVLVLGGSNSASRNGYVARLGEVMGRYASVEVDNISVGAMSTLSAVARLFELGSRGRDYDLVIYEFALNDLIAFRSRTDGELLARVAIAALIKTLDAVAPQARLLPVILAKGADFGMAKANPIYQAQTAFWADLGVTTCDVRKAVAQIFAGARPDWFYRDELHPAIGPATDIVGSIIARAALVAMNASPGTTMADISRRLAANDAYRFGLRYAGVDEIAARHDGDAQIVTRSNSLMSTRAVRIRSGALRLTGSPLSLSILSDRRHNWVRLREGEDRPYRLSTRFASVDDPQLNPEHLDRFFYAGIPIPLVLRRPFDATPADMLTIDSPGAGDRGELLHSASGFDYTPKPLAERYVDLAGVVFIERASTLTP